MTIARTLMVVAALMLAGCATDAPGAPVPGKPTETVTPTAAAQERETGLVAPAQVFGGDCEALFTTAEVSELLGGPATSIDFTGYIPHSYPYLELHGGLRCSWQLEGFAASIYVLALPAAAVDYPENTACDIWAESGATGCALELEKDGIRLSGAVFRLDGDSAKLTAAQGALTALFEERATEATAVPLPLPAIGAWAWPVDCASVVAAGDFSAVPGLGPNAMGEQVGGNDAYYPPAELALWGEFSPPYCLVYSGDIYIDFTALGGGRWVEADILAAPGAAVIAVEGIDSVVVTPDRDRVKVDAFDGPNWVSFYVRYQSNAGVAAQALVAALDTTAVE